MSIDVPGPDRIAMSQKERDVLKIMHAVLNGQRTQAEAADLLGLSVRHVRRIQRKLESGGDAAIVHGLRGRPSNHQPDADFKRRVLAAYRQCYPDFGPTFASEKLAEEGLLVCPQTLRRWLIAAGLWRRQRRREPHRSRRPRRACFGELVQVDASIHDWLEGRGEEIVLINMIDDATSYVMGRFYPAGTTEAHMDLLLRWLVRHGRPLALYSDRHSIFEAQDKGHALADAETQFGRAVRELDIELILAGSPQAKGRVERSFNTAQDRWLKELRLARVTTHEGANEVLDRLLPAHNRRFSRAARQATDAHRPLAPGHDLAAILSIQEHRVVANDYTIRFCNRFYQLLKPVYPGERGAKVVLELRLDGTMKIRFRDRYLNYEEVPAAPRPGSTAGRQEQEPLLPEQTEPIDVPAPGRCEGSAQQPSAQDTAKQGSQSSKRPAADHPWRQPFKQPKGSSAKQAKQDG
jgi:hypothetical protein